MANTSDGAGKGPPKPGSEAAPKKPAAILDLKATNVGIRDVNAGASAGGSTKPATPETIASTAAARAAAEAAAGKASAAAEPPLSPATAKPAAVKPGPATNQTSKPEPKGTGAGSGAKSGSASNGGGKPASSPPHQRSSGGAMAGLFSHLLAGVAGGALALFGWNAVGPGADTAGVRNADVPAALEQRLKALETAASRPAATAALEKQIGQLQTIEQSVAALTEEQKKLAADLKALASKPAATGTDAATAERLDKLEQTLSSLSAAAKEDPQRAGRIPQLAALTGRLSDLESNLANQLAALRKAVTQEVDSRLAQSSEASEAARAGTQRIDRELASVKTQQARNSQRLDELKAAEDRVGIALQSVRQTSAGMKSEIEALRGELPASMSKAMEPLAKRVAGLDQSVSSMVAAERDRRANAERIVLMLELGNLKRAVERGTPFAAELAELSKVAGSKLDLSALERYKNSGVPSTVELTREFHNTANAIIDADSQTKDASWTDRLLAGAKSIVKVRRVDAPADDNSAEAIVARMEKSLKSERLGDVLNEAAKLSPKAAQPARGWLDKIGARAAVERAMARIEDDLKQSLGAGSGGGKKG